MAWYYIQKILKMPHTNTHTQKTLLELKNYFSKVAGYKINTFKKLLLFHTLILNYQKEKAKKKKKKNI